MKVEIPFEPWTVPDLGDAKVDDLLERSRARASKRRRARPIAYGLCAALALWAGATAARAFLRPSLESAMSAFRATLRADIERGKRPAFRTEQYSASEREEAFYGEIL